MSDENAPVEGQGIPEPAPMGQPEEPYFSTKDPDGKDIVFKTRDELEKGFKDSFMMRGDYTRKTQEVAEQRRQIEAQRARIEKMMDDLQKKSSEYEKWDKFVSTRPDAYRALQQMLSKPPDANVAYERAQSYVDEKSKELESKLAEFEAWKREQELEREKSGYFEELAGLYPDFDSKAVEEQLKKLSSGGMKDLYETLYHSLKGRNPVELEQKAAEAAKKKAGAKVLPAGSQSSKGKSYNRLEDITADVMEAGIL